MSRYQVTVEGPEGTFSEGWPSVTEILDVALSKSGLQDWYYKQAVLGVSVLMEKYEQNLPRDVPSLHSLLKTEGLSPYAQRDQAAAGGNAIHKAVKGLAQNKPTVAKNDYPVLYEWWKKERAWKAANILAAEETLVSFSNRYAGTLDLVYTEDGKVCLSDVKSGKLRDSHYLQLEGYRWAWEERGGRHVDYMSVIQVPRDGTAVLETIVPLSDKLTEAWAGALDLYKWSKKK